MNSLEMAKAMGISPGAIRTRLTRARAQLKEEMIATMNTAYEGHSLPAGFTLNILEAVKHIKIQPTPKSSALPWGFSLAVGLIIAIMGLNPYLSIPRDIGISKGSPYPLETKVLKTGEIPVDIMKIGKNTVISQDQGKDDGSQPQNSSMLAPQAEGGTWTKKADMQTPRRYHRACTVDGKIYVMGGIPDNNAKISMSSMERYDPATDTWTYASHMPFEKWAHSAVALDGKLYVIGGVREVGKGYSIWPVLEYDSVRDVWTEKSRTPIAVSIPCINAVNGKIYVIGGLTEGDISISKVYEYDPNTDKWTRKADMPTARHAAASGVVNGRIYVMGGFGGHWMVMPGGDMRPQEEWPTLSIVEEYDPVMDTWTRKSDMPTPRGFLCASALNGKIYAIGASHPRLNTVEEHDLEGY